MHENGNWMNPDQRSATEAGLLDREPCATCEELGEDWNKGECPESKRPCGHHCNCVWTQDRCCWCGKEIEAEDDEMEGT